jgi:hypothetical protein
MAISNQAILDALYAIAPQFADPDSDTLAIYNQLIALIRCQVNETFLACCGVLAYAYLLAHMLTLRNNPQLGVANNLSEGDLSIGLAIQANGSILDSTPYGKSYIDLVNRTTIGSTVTNLPPNFGVTNYGSCGCGC